jgi:hypothetical protein
MPHTENREEQIRGFERQAAELRERLRGNEFFQKLLVKQQNKFLSGKHAYIYALEEIGVKAGVEIELFRWLFRFLSNHVHGLPLSFYRIQEDGRGRGLHTTAEEGYTSLCLSFSMTLLVGARDEIEAMFTPVLEEAAGVRVATAR